MHATIRYRTDSDDHLIRPFQSCTAALADREARQVGGLNVSTMASLLLVQDGLCQTGPRQVYTVSADVVSASRTVVSQQQGEGSAAVTAKGQLSDDAGHSGRDFPQPRSEKRLPENQEVTNHSRHSATFTSETRCPAGCLARAQAGREPGPPAP